MSIEQNKALARCFFDAINARDFAALNKIAAPDVAQGVSAWVVPGLSGMTSDHHVEITDMLAEGDRVWVRFTTSGTFAGEWRGIPAAGRKFTNATFVSFLRLAEGEIVEWSTFSDPLMVAAQLGVSSLSLVRGQC